MSYPLAIQPLVIEDEEAPKATYERILSDIAAEYSILPFQAAPPLFAFSHDEGIKHLETSKIFHLIVLDLRLPRTRRLPAPEGIDLGLELLTKATLRDAFPVPCLLIVSGHVGKTEQHRLQEALRNDFHYGRMFAKGNPDLLDQELRHAYHETLRYCSVGIHVRDSGAGQYPTIAPDEEDLLRRCVLRTPGTVGLDLSWWDAEMHSSDPAAWTKVLVGRFLLDGGQGASRPQFFKLFPGTLAPQTYASAHQLERKLSHIKITATVRRHSRALIVTEKVGGRLPRPISVEQYLQDETPESRVFSITGQIGKQLSDLGDSSPQSAALNRLLWKSHDMQRLRRQWEANGGLSLSTASGLDPLLLFEKLVLREDRIRFDELSLVHGDLHIRNIALDNTDGEPEAYIFDSASAVGRSPKGRDLAMLEVSAILHQALLPEHITGFVLPIIYGRTFVPEIPKEGPSPHVLNTVRFAKGIRKLISEMGIEEAVYSLLVLDQVMIQLGGLEFGISRNRIRYPQAVVHLVESVSRWYSGTGGEMPKHP